LRDLTLLREPAVGELGLERLREPGQEYRRVEIQLALACLDRRRAGIADRARGFKARDGAARLA